VLAVAGVAYIVAEPLLKLLARLLGFAMPEQVQPLVVALLLGVITDYSVLQFSEMRVHLCQGMNHGEAVRHSLHRNAHVVAVAALTVVGGTIALLAANLQLFRAFGPALSLTVVVGAVVSLTLTPAIMTVLGSRLFRLRGGLPRQSPAQAGTSKIAGFLVRRLTKPGWAVIGLLLAGAALLGAAWPLSTLRLDVSFTDALPSNDPVQQGAAVLKQAGVQGVTGPTEVIIFQKGISHRVAQLQKLQSEVAAQPGVAQVLGPRQDPVPEKLGVVYSINGDAARLVVILKHDPLTADAIDRLRRLENRLPALAARAGLSSARIGVTGETAIASELTELTRSNLRLTLAVAAAVDFVILALFLRALITPIVLLICSALGVAATLGITTWVFQDVRGDSGLTFYIAFAAAVLLLALGSDYNVFTVGTIWEEARRRPLRAALASAVPRSSRAITAAGLTLAATLGMVAIIPLEPSRQIAFAMALGLLIDTLLVRPVLTPAVLTLLGRAAGWPGSRIYTRHREPPPPAGPPPLAAPVGGAMAPPDVPVARRAGP
jgi:RND superfamily putative drug exporter